MALVFRDDAAALFVRRTGPMAALAADSASLFVPAGDARLSALYDACREDSLVRAWTRIELARQIAASHWNARAHSLLANLDWQQRDLDSAREHLLAALAVNPRLVGAHGRLGAIALARGNDADAVRELEAETRVGPTDAQLADRLADAYRRLGDVANARRWAVTAMRIAPESAAARESLRVIEGMAR